MASPISPMEAIEIVQKAVALFNHIRNYPEEIASVGRRIKDLEFYLGELKALIDDRQRHSLANLRPQSAQRLQSIIRDIRVDANDVYDILEIWSSAGRVSRVFFSVGRNPRRLEELTASLDGRKQDLRDILQLMGLFALQPRPQPQRAPTPTPPKSDLGVLFLDPNNIGRSKVAEGYTKLVQQWTVRTGGNWGVKFAHSAGIRIRNGNDCVDILQGLPRPVPINDIDKPPSQTAMASLFDNKYFEYPYKAGIRDYMTTSRCRGITKTLFQKHDYILVFVGREYESLLLLKKALIQAYGENIAPAGKGRIIHLGAYLNQSGKAVEIIDPPKSADGTDDRAAWNATTSKIKLAVKAFLKNELDWRQPVAGAPGQAGV